MATTKKSKKTKEVPAKKAVIKKEIAKTKGNNQAVIIAVLSTALVFVILTFTVLALTGVIRFGGGGDATVTEKADRPDEKAGRDSDSEPVSGTVCSTYRSSERLRSICGNKKAFRTGACIKSRRKGSQTMHY